MFVVMVVLVYVKTSTDGACARDADRFSILNGVVINST